MVSMAVPHPRSMAVRPGPMSSLPNAVKITAAVRCGEVAYCSKSILGSGNRFTGTEERALSRCLSLIFGRKVEKPELFAL